MRVSVCLGAILIPEYLDFHSGYSAPGSRIAGMEIQVYSRIYSGINSYSGISQTNAPLRYYSRVKYSRLIHSVKSRGFAFFISM